MATESWPTYAAPSPPLPEWPPRPAPNPGPPQLGPDRMEEALELSRAYRAVAVLLGQAEDHNGDILDLAMSIGSKLGLHAKRLRRLEFAALLHDVGKTDLPREMLERAGSLTADERMLMEQHPVRAQAMLEEAGGILREVGPIVRSSHERYDGRGYPDGLAGEAIPIESRIICCCDAYKAMTSHRPYRPALPAQEALNRLQKHREAQFDPDVVDALFGIVTPPSL